jgi:hypothetical protein
MVIVLENKDYGDVIGPAPYITSLAHRCGVANDYHAVARPSLPNYIAMTSGTTDGATNCAPSSCPRPSNNVFAQTAFIGREWRAYQESMEEPCALGDAGRYVVRHNPAAYYVYSPTRTDCLRWDVPLGTRTSGPLRHALDGDLKAYSFVTPNLCHDMHDCPVSAGDAWLAAWMPLIVKSPAYQAGRLAVFITWDEGRQAQHIPLVVVSPYTRPGTASMRVFNHYSLLRATEYIIGARRYLGGAANLAIAGLADAFGLYPTTRG